MNSSTNKGNIEKLSIQRCFEDVEVFLDYQKRSGSTIILEVFLMIFEHKFLKNYVLFMIRIYHQKIYKNHPTRVKKIKKIQENYWKMILYFKIYKKKI